MIRALLLVLAFLSPIFFPWPLTLLLVFAAAFANPLAPLAVGAFADALYFSHDAYAFPFYTVVGVLVSVVAFFLYRFIETSLMRI